MNGKKLVSLFLRCLHSFLLSGWQLRMRISPHPLPILLILLPILLFHRRFDPVQESSFSLHFANILTRSSPGGAKTGPMICRGDDWSWEMSHRHVDRTGYVIVSLIFPLDSDVFDVDRFKIKRYWKEVQVRMFETEMKVEMLDQKKTRLQKKGRIEAENYFSLTSILRIGTERT